MNIMLIIHGISKEIIPTDRVPIRLPREARLPDLRKKLDKMYPQLFGLRNMFMMVKGDFIPEDYQFSEGEEVVFAPAPGC